jgi:hypothetical protein
MTTTPEPPRCNAARLLRWLRTSHDGARDNMSSRPILARLSSQIDPAISLKRTSFATASLRDPSHPSRRPFFVNRSVALKSP